MGLLGLPLRTALTAFCEQICRCERLDCAQKREAAFCEQICRCERLDCAQKRGGVAACGRGGQTVLDGQKSFSTQSSQRGLRATHTRRP